MIEIPKAVEECVKKRLANPDFQAPENSKYDREQFAWALCQTLYKKGKLDGMAVEIDGTEYWSLDGTQWFSKEEGNVAGFRLEPVTDADMEKLHRLLGAEADKNEILKFSNAFLAREEVNKNRDELSKKNLEDIARTLPLRAIDYEHREQEIVGFFIDAAVKGDGVATDGIIFARRRPDVAMGLMNGELPLSIEADADSALCSMCGESFKSKDDYCSHLQTRLQGSGASRQFPGKMWALGGAVTKNPAGTETGVPRESIVMIASQIEMEKGGENVSEIVIDLWSQADEDAFFATEYTDMEGKQLSYKEREGLKDSDFALIQKEDGQKRRRFPIHDCAHARNALARLPVAHGLSSEERASIKRKAEAKLNSDECKSQRKSDAKGGVGMEELEKVKAELQEKVKALEALEAEKAGLATQLEAAQKERDDLKAQADIDKKFREREAKLAGRLAPEVITAKREVILAMDDAAFELFLESLEAAKGQKAGTLGQVMAGSSEPPPPAQGIEPKWVK